MHSRPIPSAASMPIRSLCAKRILVVLAAKIINLRLGLLVGCEVLNVGLEATAAARQTDVQLKEISAQIAIRRVYFGVNCMQL